MPTGRETTWLCGAGEALWAHGLNKIGLFFSLLKLPFRAGDGRIPLQAVLQRLWLSPSCRLLYSWPLCFVTTHWLRTESHQDPHAQPLPCAVSISVPQTSRLLPSWNADILNAWPASPSGEGNHQPTTSRAFGNQTVRNLYQFSHIPLARTGRGVPPNLGGRPKL